MKKVRIAVFDIDGTIFRSSLAIKLIDGLVSAGVFPKQASREMEKDYLLWLNRKGSYERYIKQVITVYDKYIVGSSKKKVDAVAKKVISWEKDRVYRFTREYIKTLKRKGYLLLAVSASPQYIVEKFAHKMGFDHSFGHLPEVKKGKFTGKHVLSNTISNKAKVITLFAKEKGLAIDYKNSVAVGDTEGDIPMLTLVGNPIAFNPNKTLALFAKKKRWTIVIERKDVIYEASSSRILPH